MALHNHFHIQVKGTARIFNSGNRQRLCVVVKSEPGSLILWKKTRLIWSKYGAGEVNPELQNMPAELLSLVSMWSFIANLIGLSAFVWLIAILGSKNSRSNPSKALRSAQELIRSLHSQRSRRQPIVLTSSLLVLYWFLCWTRLPCLLVQNFTWKLPLEIAKTCVWCVQWKESQNKEKKWSTWLIRTTRLPHCEMCGGFSLEYSVLNKL